MNLILYGIAAIAFTVGAVFLVGFALPETRSGTLTKEIAAPPRIVRDVLLDVEAQPSWREGIARVEHNGDGWTETTTRGEQVAFRLEEATDEEIRMSFASSYGYHGQWSGRLRAVPQGRTQLTVTESATTPSPLGRLMSRVFFNPEAFAAAYLEELAREAARRTPGD
jgi:hypothetical protein